MAEIPKYVCPYCSAEFNGYETLASHITTEHPVAIISLAKEPENTFIKGMGLVGMGGWRYMLMLRMAE